MIAVHGCGCAAHHPSVDEHGWSRADTQLIANAHLRLYALGVLAVSRHVLNLAASSPVSAAYFLRRSGSSACWFWKSRS